MPAAADPTFDPVRIGIVSVSDRASGGVYEDKGLPALKDWLGRALRNPLTFDARLIPDEQATISATLIELVDAGCHLVLTTGGTGPALRDVTPEATLAVADKEMPGFGEHQPALRTYGHPVAPMRRDPRQQPDHQPARSTQGDCRNTRRLALGQRGVTGGRHICSRTLLHRPDRRPVYRNRCSALQGVQAQVGATACGGLTRFTCRPVR